MSASTSEECPDGHRCENGSKCMEDEYDEGGYRCDCDRIENSVYAGLYCEHVATEYCTFQQEVSKTSFCTNGGTCKVQVSADAAHLGCDCVVGYEGEHCQFVEGTKPDNWASGGNGAQSPLAAKGNQAAASGGGLSGGVTAVIVIIVLAVVGGMFYIIYRKRSSGSTLTEKHNIPSSELALDADGAVLKDSMAMSNNSTTGSGPDGASGDGYDKEGDDVMEDIKLSGSTENGGAPEII